MDLCTSDNFGAHWNSRVEIVYLFHNWRANYPCWAGNLKQGKKLHSYKVYNSRTGDHREMKFGEHGVKIQNLSSGFLIRFRVVKFKLPT